MKKVILTAVLTAISVSNIIFSQDEVMSSNENIVIIDKVAEKPENLSLLVWQIPLWHMAGSKINSSLLDLKTTIAYVGKGNLNYGISYKYGLGDHIFPENNEFTDVLSNELVMSKFKVPHAQELNVYGTYFFNSSMKEVEQTLRLKQVGQTVYVTSVPAMQQVKMGVNLGYAQGFTWYNMNKIDLSVSPRIDSPEIIEQVSMQSMSTVQEYKFLKAGISISKAVNIKVNAQGYGERRASWVSVDNFNVIAALQNDFDDVYVGRVNTDGGGLTVMLVEYTMDAYNKKLPIGFEYTHHMYSKGSAWSYEYGIKYLPGLVKNLNFMATLGVSLNIDFLKKNNF
ncbi:MAG: hypothetical protein EP305_12725 [Bacteroidetes bacterium]|nr:MAG: hypothetical protein EP305_12725 [Bacteroidota bacterium]